MIIIHAEWPSSRGQDICIEIGDLKRLSFSERRRILERIARGWPMPRRTA
jgi:hypothetical protein